MADYLKSRGHTIAKMIFLSPRNGRYIEIDPTIPTYQITYATQALKYINGVLKLVIVPDFLVGDNFVKKSVKYGLFKRVDLTRFECHSTSDDPLIFNCLEDLVPVSLSQNYNNVGRIYYSQSNEAHGTLFYYIEGASIQRTLVAPNHPRWNGNTITP